MSGDTEDRIAQRQYSVGGTIAMTVTAMALGMLPVWLVGGLAVQMQGSIGFTDAQLGLVTGTFFAVSAVGAIPSGSLSKRIGWQRGMLASGLLGAFAFFGTAVLAWNFTTLLLFIALGSVANALAQPAANSALVERVSGSRHGLAFGVKQSSVPSATLVAGLAVPLIGLTIGWRYAFALASIGSLLLGLSAWRLGARIRTSRSQGTSTEQRAAQPPIEPGRRFPLLVLAMVGCLGTAGSNVLGAFLVVYVVRQGLADGLAGLLLAYGSIVNISVRLVMGWLSDRRKGSPVLAIAGMLTLGALGFAILLFARSPLMLVVATTIAFGAGWGWNGLFHMATMMHYRRQPAAATGVISTFLFTGGVIGPALFGFLVETRGFAAGWRMSIGVLLLGALFAVWAAVLLRRHPAPDEPMFASPAT